MTYTTYKKFRLTDGTVNENSILVPATSDHPDIYIPCNENNKDYQDFLEWKSKGNKLAEADSLSWDDIRLKRNKILIDTDWTMTTGATVDQAQWAAYRQTIRDIPQTYKDKTPDDVVWPTQPSTAGPNS